MTIRSGHTDLHHYGVLWSQKTHAVVQLTSTSLDPCNPPRVPTAISHTALSHLENKGTESCSLNLAQHVTQSSRSYWWTNYLLGLNAHTWNWILDFLTERAEPEHIWSSRPIPGTIRLCSRDYLFIYDWCVWRIAHFIDAFSPWG